MKKILPVIVFIIVAAAVLFFVFSSDNKSTTQGTTTAKVSADAQGGAKQAANGGEEGADEGDENGGAEGDEGLVEETKSATEVYSSAEDALNAVKKAAADYDDLVLEQFTRPGPDCSWCSQFYSSIKDLINAPDTTQESKGYFAELLAVSGRVDNVQSLVEMIKNAKDSQEADLFSEALELSTGEDDVVRYLGSEMESSNAAVQEASIAAVTNQGTRLAAELLYNQTAKVGDPDGYYSRGTGLGEFIPVPEAVPYLQDLLKKQDQYSPLAAKALVNSGIDGLRLVFEEAASIKDPEVAKRLLNGISDHINFEDGVEPLLQKYAESTQPAVADTAKKALEDFRASAEEDQGEAPNMSVDPSLAGEANEKP